MQSSIARSSLDEKRLSRPRKRRSQNVRIKPKVIDAATLASNFQLQEERREIIYSLIALGMKVGFLVLAISTLLKLGLTSLHRIQRYSEISSALNAENVKMRILQKRFDNLFTIDGERRLMNEQEQWIAPNRVRIMWKEKES